MTKHSLITFLGAPFSMMNLIGLSMLRSNASQSQTSDEVADRRQETR